MEFYTTENEQVDALRRFFAENGKALIVGLVLGVGALVGWRYWQHYQNSNNAAASQAYQQISKSLMQDKESDVQAAKQFIKENKNSYGVLAALSLAKHFVDQNDFANAEQQLAQAQKLTKDDNLLSVINLRLARVQLQERNFADALSTLDKVKGSGWVPIRQEIRGDVLLAQGDVQGAKAAYKIAAESSDSDMLQSLLRIKLNNLAG